jgi:dimethylhistidine N-methyltransferase
MLIKCLTNSIEDNQKSLDNDGLDIVQGLQSYPKTLPPKYFYDDLGSELFEQICLLPEYYPTRTEAAILEEYADEIAQMTNCCELVELGSGSSTKTRFLLDAYQKIADSCSYLPIDVSGGILKASVLELQQQYPDFFIQGLLGTYEQALEHLELERSNSERSRMIFFLGSSIGNFTASECDRFLHKVASTLRKGDYFLLGTDLQKPKEILEAAYNDSQNVTAAFNLNILSHLNWRFQGDFDPNLFTHQAIYNQTENQIEMYLHCRDDHQVSLEVLDLNIQFKTGESILTEISSKFDLEVLKTQLELQGLKTLKVWTDPQKLFSLVLAQA